VAAAVAEGLLDGGERAALETYAGEVAGHPARVPADPAPDVRIAELAVTIALRRHGRPTTPGATARPLRDVALVIGSGGVLRHASPRDRGRVLAPALHDHRGGWRVPDRAASAVDERSVLFAAGLLATAAPATASRLTRDLTRGAAGDRA
jgi:hypothetical protein